MRISDWSSDVCSSDLFLIAAPGATLAETEILAACRASLARYKVPVRALVIDTLPSIASPNGVKIQRGRLREMAQRQIGRASCRERVGQYVEISVVAGTLKKKKQSNS